LLPDEYIGTGKTLDAGSFFSGLIDNVCFYNQMLSIERFEALAQ
jgi:K+-transporting ATPase A subunit